MPDLAQSEALYARATGLISAYSQTLAKGPTQYVKGVAPVYPRRGQGAHVWDVDGNQFGKTGAEVTSAAVRLARAYARHEKVLCCVR
jgi:glutamate-1-semialdehyde aminotransferase